MVKKKLKFWSIPVTAALDDAVSAAVAVNAHVSKSDFVRDAVREKLAKMGISPGEMEAVAGHGLQCRVTGSC